jgi:hypothetical protein
MSGRIAGDSLIAALIQDGVIPAGAPSPPSRPEDRPWFVSALQGTAGWLAGIFVIVFVSSVFEPRAAATLALVAVAFLAAAFALYRASWSNAFVDQLALAASIAGQLAATAAFTAAFGPISLIAALVALMQCALVFIMPNRLARSLAAFFACVAWALAIRFAWWGGLELRDSAQHAVSLAPALIGWAVIWIPVAALVSAAVRGEARWMARADTAPIVRPALSGMLLALTFGTFASEPIAALMWDTQASTQNWLVLWPLLNAATALFAGFCAFRLRNRAIVGTAIVASVLHLGQFYFLLGTTLVMKSIIMVTVGALLLGAGLILRRRPSAPLEGTP